MSLKQSQHTYCFEHIYINSPKLLKINRNKLVSNNLLSRTYYNNDEANDKNVQQTHELFII